MKNTTTIQIQTNFDVSPEGYQYLYQLHQFAQYQALHNYEVQMMPAKLNYKLNEEFKLSLVALLLTCSMLDPNRDGQETEKFFNTHLNITQTGNVKNIIVNKIRPILLNRFLIPEIIKDWILYRDCCGDGIHALIDHKTYLQGLENYQSGGSPAYEFARFYRKFMENKLQKQQTNSQQLQQIALKSLTDQVIQKQLDAGYSANDILQQIQNNNLFLDSNTSTLKLPPKKK